MPYSRRKKTQPSAPIAMVRCRLDGSQDRPQVRYVPAAEFELWRHLMVTKHSRVVAVDEVSVWVPEGPEALDGAADADALTPVVRVRFDKPDPHGPNAVVPVVRFLPAEAYPQAKSALLAHFDRRRSEVDVTPGYFVSKVA